MPASLHGAKLQTVLNSGNCSETLEIVAVLVVDELAWFVAEVVRVCDHEAESALVE